MKIRKIGATLALSGALVGAVALAGPANAASTSVKTTTIVRPEGVWVDTGMDFNGYSACSSYGSWLVAQGDYSAYTCVLLTPPPTYYYYYELWGFAS